MSQATLLRTLLGPFMILNFKQLAVRGGNTAKSRNEFMLEVTAGIDILKIKKEFKYVSLKTHQNLVLKHLTQSLVLEPRL